MNFNIPLFELNFDEDEEYAVLETIRSRWISTGPKTKEFENKFAEMLKVNYALALCNCTVALHLALKVLNIRKGDEVICPSLTFVATVNAIKYVDATPVFCDVKSLFDLTIDPNQIRNLLTSRTKAIIVMHYGGFSCDMDRIMEIAEEFNLKVIEDACHGPMAEYKRKKLGSMGDIGCFSFFSNKNLSTGEGGMLITNNQEYYEKSKLLRSHGMTSMSYERAKGHSTSYDVIDLGYNYRLDDIRASIGIVQLEKLYIDLKKRNEVRKLYVEKLSDINKIIIPFKHYNYFSSNYIFPIVLKDSNSKNRDLVRKKLAEAGIQTSVHYPAVHRFSIYSTDISLPRTEYIADNLITLPMYSKLSFKNIDYIVEQIHKVL